MDEGTADIAMPLPLTPILGRDREVAAARALLTTRRLVTVVGTGGCGKTRLAAEVVASTENVVLVDLAPITEPGHVLPTIARALGLREAGARPVSTTLLRHLRDRQVLLLLDNLEHLPDAAAGIADLLARCPAVQVLATSRSPLRVPGEQVLQVDPLPVPDLRVPAGPEDSWPARASRCSSHGSAPSSRTSPSPRRTRAPSRRSVVHSTACRSPWSWRPRRSARSAWRRYWRASRSSSARCRSPRGRRRTRHRSLADAVAWSVALLDDRATTLFGRLSVFAGGWTAHAAQQVCGEPGGEVLPALATLVEHSLVDVVHGATTVRYRMLETLRRYSAGMARDAGDHDTVRLRHADWCRTLGSRACLMDGPDEVVLLDAAETELDNIRAALEYCGEAETSAGLRLAADLYYLWDIRGYLTEGRDHLRRLLGRHDAASDPVAHAMALQSLGLLLLW